MGILIFLIVAALMGIIAYHFITNDFEKVEEEQKANHLKLLEIYKGYNNYLNDNGFTIKKRIKLQRSSEDPPSQEVAVDLENQKIFIFMSNIEPFIVNFSELVSCDIEIGKSPQLKNNKVRNAVVGGLIAGPTGAIIGSGTTPVKEIITSVFVKIVTTNIENPIITLVPFFSSSQIFSPEEIGDALHFSEQIHATLQGIMHTNKLNRPYQNNM